MNLVPAIKEMRKAISDLKSKHDNEMAELELGLETLTKLNTTCEKCNGAGKYMRPRACAEDDSEREYITCVMCRGSGIAQKSKEADYDE